jgi:catechol 2,3-dioxygenase-like lactoylglutathione lyase family enzyme
MTPAAIDPATNGVEKKAEKPSHPSPVALAHCVLRTTAANYPGMVHFYRNLLNAQIVHETPVLTFLRYDFEHHRIAILQTPETTAKAENTTSAEVDHIAFSYSSLTALARTYVSLKSIQKPLLPIWTVNHGPTTSLYYRDPDGNKVELQVDNFEDAKEADAFMKGPLFGMNPIGTDFDVEEWASRILGKAKQDGQEGLDKDEVKHMKMRSEIGERYDLPEGLI